METQILNNLKVLLVDDDPITNFINARKLWQRNIIQVEVAENGFSALNYLEGASELPDIVFLDVNMPVMDGFEFLDSIKEIQKYKDIVVVVLTSSIRVADKETALAYDQVMDFIEKPLDCDKLDAFLIKAGFLDGLNQTG